MGNTNLCCDKPTLITNRELEFKANKRENNIKSKQALDNKISTEINDQTDKKESTFTFQKFNNSKQIESNLNLISLDRVRYLEKIVNQTKKLHLEVINSNVLPPRLIIRINAQGIESSLRNEKDGFVYFGSENPSEEQDEINDYLIRLRDQESSEKSRGRHFQISYNIENKDYFIKDLGLGYGAFYRIKSQIVLKNNYLINIGDTFIVVSFSQEEDIEETFPIREINLGKILNLRVFKAHDKSENFSFKPNSSVIRLGRSKNCEVEINDNMLSRYHCFIEFNNEIGWVIQDGVLVKNENDEIEHKFSTNGTWMYLIEDTLINEGMIFKANHTLFQCHFVE